jgi:hypothetical protein
LSTGKLLNKHEPSNISPLGKRTTFIGCWVLATSGEINQGISLFPGGTSIAIIHNEEGGRLSLQ